MPFFKKGKIAKYFYTGLIILAVSFVFMFLVHKGFEIIHGSYRSIAVHDTIRYLRPEFDPILGSSIAEDIQIASNKTGLPPNLIIAVIWHESRFNPVARSKANAVGLMQVIEKYHKDTMKDLGITSDSLWYTSNNIMLGATILKNYIIQTGSIQGGLEKYLGKHGPKYYTNVLETYTNLSLISILQQAEVKNVK